MIMQQFRELLKAKSDNEIKDYMDSFKPNEKDCDFYKLAAAELTQRANQKNQNNEQSTF